MNKRLKNLCIFVGFLFILLISVENAFYIQQPLNSIGAQLIIEENQITLGSVRRKGQAYQAGLRNGDIIKNVNNVTAEDFRNKLKTEKRTVFYKYTSHFFEFGNDYTFEKKDGTKITLQCHNGNVKQMFNSSNKIMRIKLLTAFFFFVAGIFCSFYYGGYRTTFSLVFFTYFSGLGVYNSFTNIFESEKILIYEEILGDIGIIFGLFFLFKYIAHTFMYFNIYKGIVITMATLNVSMVALLICKYFYYICFSHQIVGGFFKYYSSVALLISFFPILFSALVMIINSPSQSTYIFRYTILSSFSVWIPVCVIILTLAITRELFLAKDYYNILIGSLACMPVIMILSIIQAWGKNFATYIHRYITFMYQCILFALVIVFFKNKTSIFYLMIFASPIFTRFFYLLINRMLSTSSERDSKRIEVFRQKISEIDEIIPLLRFMIETLMPTINCKFIYIQGFKDGIEMINYRSSYEIPAFLFEGLVKEANEHKGKDRIFSLEDGSFVINYYVGDELILRFIIGPKNNQDDYIPGEKQTVEIYTEECLKQFLLIINNEVSNQLEKRNEKIIELQNHTIFSMANLIESRDGGTGEHVKRTSLYSKLLATKAKEMGVYSEQITPIFIEMLEKAAPLHDIGKIVVSDTILQKPGKLTPEEFDIMKTHTVEGGKIVQEILHENEDKEYTRMACDVALYHHEKWNGKGYPYGLKGTEIPLCARILAFADVFDALISPRCYKEPFPIDKAFQIMEEEGNEHFDPELLKVFLSIKKELLEIKNSTN